MTATMNDPNGVSLNAAGIMTEASLVSEELNEGAMEQLLTPETPMQLASIIYTECMAQAQSDRDAIIYNAESARVSCYGLASINAATSIESCMSLTPLIPPSITLPYCTALSAAYFSWDILVCDDVKADMISYATSEYAADALACGETGIYPPDPGGTLFQSCTAYGTTIHAISWTEFFAQPDYYEIWGTPTTAPFTPMLADVVPGGTFSWYVENWGADFNIQLKACKDGQCTGLSSVSYLATWNCQG